MRKIIRAKCNLPTNTFETILYEDEYKLKLFNLQERLDQAMISNLQTQMNNKGLVQETIQASINLIQNKMKTPIDILSGPLPLISTRGGNQK